MKRSAPRAGLSEIAPEVLAHLVRHPEAQDTLEGITQWWLLEQEIARRTAEVQTALTELVESGLVTQRLGEDGAIHYRANREKAGWVRGFLEERRRLRDQEKRRKQ